jgi:hypothetical protein
MKLVEAVMRANETFLHESIYPTVFRALKAEFPGVRLFTQLWDQDENNPLMVWFERELIEVSDLVSVPDSISRAERMRRGDVPYAGLTNSEAVAWLPTRPNPAVFKPRDLPKSIDVSVLGSSSPFRQSVIADLSARYGERFVHAGGYMKKDKFVSYADYADVIHRSRIIVNAQTSADGQQIKGRTREVLACGGFLLDQRNAETTRFFEDSGAVLWQDIDDLHAKLDHYLAHDDERRRVATATHQWYVQRYPTESYFEEILTALQQRTATAQQ